MRQLSAGSQYAGLRLDVALAQMLERSRSACAEMIRAGHVFVDGQPAKASLILEPHSKISVELPPLQAASARPQALPLRIVHDEMDFCVVDKPAGMATHPAPGTADGTLVNALLARFPSLPAINGVLRPGIVHRLDKDTSGLLVVAKTERAMSALTKAMAARRIKRLYDAVVWGVPQNARGLIEAPIGRNPTDRTKLAVREHGRRAVTHYRTIETWKVAGGLDVTANAALLRLELETGRTHQIRVHCAAIGHPLVADKIYGPMIAGLTMPRQALHAAELSFEHPVTGKALRVTAPWPADFEALVQRLRSGQPP